MNYYLFMPQFGECLKKEKKLESKNQITKEELYNSFKFHCNAVAKLKKLSKANDYLNSFEDN